MMRLVDHKQDQDRKFPFINKLERDLAKINDQMPLLVQSKEKQKQLFDIYLSGKKTKKKTNNQQFSTVNNQASKRFYNTFTTIEYGNHKLIDQQAQTQGKFLPFQASKKAKRNIVSNKHQRIAKITIIPDQPQIPVISKSKLTTERYFESISRGRQGLLNKSSKNNSNKKVKQSPSQRKLQALRYQSISMRRSRRNSAKGNNNEMRKFSQSCKSSRGESKLPSQVDNSLLHKEQDRNNSNIKVTKEEILTKDTTIMTTHEIAGSSCNKTIQDNQMVKQDHHTAYFQGSKLGSNSEKIKAVGQKQNQTQTVEQKNYTKKFPRRNIQLTTVEERSQTQKTQKEVNDTQNIDSFSILPNPNFHASQSVIKPLVQHLQGSRSQQKLNHKTESIQVSSQEIQKQSQLNQQKQYQKIDQIIQFPEINELKISNQNETKSTLDNFKQNHPIKNNFNDEKDLSWITQFFRPKSHFIKSIPSDQCIIKKYRNGVYFGQISQNKKHGFGVIFYFDGRMFEGKFQNDLKEGQGYEQFPDGSKYTGEFRGGTKNGKGTFQWQNGEVYEGQWQNGRKHGSGMWKSAEGQSYIGEWKNGKPQGFGVYVSSLGDRYEGEFENSQKQGLGTQRFHNGETYVGEYRKNRPNGKGEYFWTDGSYYKGDFANNMRHGQGYFTDPKKRVQYKGQYKNDKRCGYGQLKYQQYVYVGNFENDYRHGYGELYIGDELKFKGFWVNDVLLSEEGLSENNLQLLSLYKKRGTGRQVQEPQKTVKPKARINRMQGMMSQEGKITKKQRKSKSPANKSIQNQQNSRQQSCQKRSCGCTRRH